MCSLLPLDHRIHTTECFMFKGFFLSNLPPNTCTHLMREDINDPRKLSNKAYEIWQSASDRSVNVISAASPPVPVPEDAALNTLCQQPPPRPTPPAAPCPAPCSSVLLLRPPLRTGTIATMRIRLSLVVPPAPGFQ